jgi:hypothetical protein
LTFPATSPPLSTRAQAGKLTSIFLAPPSKLGGFNEFLSGLPPWPCLGPYPWVGERKVQIEEAV